MKLLPLAGICGNNKHRDAALRISRYFRVQVCATTTTTAATINTLCALLSSVAGPLALSLLQRHMTARKSPSMLATAQPGLIFMVVSAASLRLWTTRNSCSHFLFHSSSSSSSSTSSSTSSSCFFSSSSSSSSLPPPPSSVYFEDANVFIYKRSTFSVSFG